MNTNALIIGQPLYYTLEKKVITVGEDSPDVNPLQRISYIKRNPYVFRLLTAEELNEHFGTVKEQTGAV